MTDDNIKAMIERVKSNIRVTKVVATRSVKGKGGDTYAGFSAAWNTVQDDSGGGIDALLSDTDEAQSGMTLREARVAHLLVAMQADLAAHDAALAGGSVSSNYHSEATRTIKAGYSRMIREVIAGPTPDKATESK